MNQRIKGAHNPERATSMRLCHGVFGANLQYLLLSSTNPSAKPTDLNNV